MPLESFVPVSDLPEVRRKTQLIGVLVTTLKLCFLNMTQIRPATGRQIMRVKLNMGKHTRGHFQDKTDAFYREGVFYL